MPPAPRSAAEAAVCVVCMCVVLRWLAPQCITRSQTGAWLAPSTRISTTTDSFIDADRSAHLRMRTGYCLGTTVPQLPRAVTKRMFQTALKLILTRAECASDSFGTYENLYSQSLVDTILKNKLHNNKVSKNLDSNSLVRFNIWTLGKSNAYGAIQMCFDWWIDRLNRTQREFLDPYTTADDWRVEIHVHVHGSLK